MATNAEEQVSQDVLAALAPLMAVVSQLPFSCQDRIRRILDHGLTRMRADPVGREEDPKVVMAWMLDPKTWNEWSKW